MAIALSLRIGGVLVATSAILIRHEGAGVFDFALRMIEHMLLVSISMNLFWWYFQLFHVFTARWQLLVSLMVLSTLAALIDGRDLNLLHELTRRLIPRSTARIRHMLLNPLRGLSDGSNRPITILLLLLLEFHKLLLGILKLF